MGSTNRLLLFLAMLLFGAFVAFERYHGPFVNAYVDTTHWQVQDWIFWIFGPMFVLVGLWDLLQQRGGFDWRSALWLVIGAAMIYAEVADVVWLKELTCRMMQRHHYSGDGPCYLPR